MRIYIAWIVGIGLFLLMLFLTESFAQLIGITTSVDYAESIIVSRGRYYEEEVSGHTTSIGIFFMFLSYAIAIRGGMAINSGKISGNVSKKGNFQLLIVGSALLSYGGAGQIIFFILDLEGILFNLIDAALGIGIAYLFYNYYKKRVEKFEE